jgi:hypothetical protein
MCTLIGKQVQAHGKGKGANAEEKRIIPLDPAAYPGLVGTARLFLSAAMRRKAVA